MYRSISAEFGRLCVAKAQFMILMQLVRTTTARQTIVYKPIGRISIYISILVTCKIVSWLQSAATMRSLTLG